ncbi:hypothetical protein MASR1M32_24010 [Rhodobacter sp.]
MELQRLDVLALKLDRGDRHAVFGKADLEPLHPGRGKPGQDAGGTAHRLRGNRIAVIADLDAQRVAGNLNPVQRDAFARKRLGQALLPCPVVQIQPAAAGGDGSDRRRRRIKARPKTRPLRADGETQLDPDFGAVKVMRRKRGPVTDPIRQPKVERRFVLKSRAVFARLVIRRIFDHELQPIGRPPFDAAEKGGIALEPGLVFELPAQSAIIAARAVLEAVTQNTKRIAETAVRAKPPPAKPDGCPQIGPKGL